MERKRKTITLGSSPTPKAGEMAQREEKLWTQRGFDVLRHPLPCPVQGSWAVEKTMSRGGVFWEETKTGLKRYTFDSWGLRAPVGREVELPPEKRGTVEYIGLEREVWAGERAARARFGLGVRRVKAAVEGEGPLREALALTLEKAGGRVEGVWRPGIPAFRLEKGGFELTARDERGAVVDSGQLLGVLTLIEMEQGGGVVALPPGSSMSARLVAAGFQSRVLELDRDGPSARGRYAALPWLREGPCAAARILYRMAASGQSLEGLVAKTPRFQSWQRELALDWDRERVLTCLARQGAPHWEGRGYRVRVGQSWLYVRGVGAGRLRVSAEGPDLEAAEELWDLCLRELEREG